MTLEDRNVKLKNLISCMKCEVSGKVCDENCPTQYEAGTMGEIIENLEAVSKAIDKASNVGHWIDADGDNAICSCCNRLNHLYGTYCKHCGAKMESCEQSEDDYYKGAQEEY